MKNIEPEFGPNIPDSTPSLPPHQKGGALKTSSHGFLALYLLPCNFLFF
jgi:hypothetical protein